MDWPSSRAMFGYEVQPTEGEMEGEDGDDDFYGLNAAAKAVPPPANQVGWSKQHDTQNRLTSSEQKAGHEVGRQSLASLQHLNNAVGTDGATAASEEQRKAENERKAADLRARLIAQRQNTPTKPQPGANKPPKTLLVRQSDTDAQASSLQTEHSEPSADPNNVYGYVSGLECLLAEGKAAADAKTRDGAAAAPTQTHIYATGNESSLHHTPSGKGEPSRKKAVEPSRPDSSMTKTEQPTWAAKLTDAYYSDLPLWLEVTGYHNVEYRNSKLATHKERRSLEQEAARIAERLQSLRQAEQADLANLRSASAQPTSAPHLPPPPLPAMLPDGGASQQMPTNKSHDRSTATNGVKRARSPEQARPEKVLRQHEDAASDHTHAAKAALPTSTTALRRARSPSAELGRRISYPEIHRTSGDNYHAPESYQNDFRDPSFERRKQFYKLEPESNAGLPLSDRYERPQYIPREAARGRTGYSSVNRPPSGSGHHDTRRAYRGSADLDLSKGGVRYFMIKSWNHQNVATAMRDGLWATQQKNEQTLTEAYNTSRHVVLLFSVNKSMQFQGYALMASPPNPSLPKPQFCSQLHWKTSPTFTLRWLARQPVHFRHVGHLKNDLNLDEHNRPMAVLVGKDGQEISPEAGRGVVEILDDAEDVDGRRHSPAATGNSASHW